MERHELMRLLVGDDAASKAALAALADGADYVVWEAGTRLSDGHAGIFAMRLRRMRRKGPRTWDGNERWNSSVSALSPSASGRSPPPTGHGSTRSSSRRTVAHWWPAPAYGIRSSSHHLRGPCEHVSARLERVVTLQNEAGRAVLKVNARIKVKVVPVPQVRVGKFQQSLREEAKSLRVGRYEGLAN